MKPLVGVIAETFDLKTPFAREVEKIAPHNEDFLTQRVVYNSESFVTYFQSAGCHTCIISPLSDVSIIDHLDVLLVPGGPDIPPELYGQEPHPKTSCDDKVRDEFEPKIIKLAIEKNIPIFAICRGFQMVNALLGGSLHQHLPERSSMIQHRSPESPVAYQHTVKTKGWLKELVGEELQVNSWHHQGVDTIAPNLTVLAEAEDGIIEAYQSQTNDPPILGIQWHPEILQDEPSMKIVNYFVSTFIKK